MFNRKKRKTNNKTVSVLDTDDKLRQVEKIAAHFEKIRMAEYIDLLSRPSRIIWVNLLGGISRGVGLTIGATLVIAILFKIISVLISMNIPYLTEMLQEVVQIVKETPAGQNIHVPATQVLSQPTETGSIITEIPATTQAELTTNK
ncbi:MAG: hypothetical protein IJY58_03955 [Alphaproteobacteria bacterium]|nr:hypothetical protein [Alphaproteobacteria bacterium]